MAETNMAAAVAASNPVNIADLIAEYRSAHDAFTEGDQATVERYHAALDAVRDARPTAPGELAAQLRWHVAELPELSEEPIGSLLAHVAGLLEVAAMLQKGHVLLAPQDVVTIRGALVATVEEHDDLRTRCAPRSRCSTAKQPSPIAASPCGWKLSG